MLLLILSSMLLLFMNIDFLAFIYIIVYVGAISIFFLFSVMLLDLRADEEIKYSFKVVSRYFIPFSIASESCHFVLLQDHYIVDLKKIIYINWNIFFDHYRKNLIWDADRALEAALRSYATITYWCHCEKGLMITESFGHVVGIEQILLRWVAVQRVLDKTIFFAYEKRLTDNKEYIGSYNQYTQENFLVYNRFEQSKESNDLLLLGHLLFTEYSPLICLSGLLLLLSLFSVIVLTFEYSKIFNKRQSNYQQLNTKITSSLILMPTDYTLSLEIFLFL